MTRPTPGPWRVHMDVNGRCLITNDAGVPLGELFLKAGDIPRAELEANVSLVLMAPKMLEACRRAMRDEPDESLFRAVVEEAGISLKDRLEFY